MKTKYWAKVSDFEGLPKLSDFKIIEEEIDENLKEGEILTEALVVSVDPYIRAFPFPNGVPVNAFQASRVIKSANKKYPKGSIVMFHGGWQTICKTTDEDVWSRVDDVEPKVKVSHAIGSIGMPGVAAYYGLLDYCKPKEGETVFVNGSAGAVGSLVGQIAKIKGCKAVGCCGSQAKIDFVKSVGFDDAFNYKTEKPWPEALKRVAPNGIDCFFDNVGGQLASDTMYQMNMHGRVTVCGYMGSYNSSNMPKADIIQPAVLGKRLNINSFVMFDPHFRPKFAAAMKQLSQWTSEGKIKVSEKIVDGFENIPTAFISMLCGENIGKTVVQVSS